MSNVGYARVSTRSQSTDTQIIDLQAAGCEKIFTDHGVSGKHASRPELDACLAYLRPGDVLVITRLSRAMRSLKHLLAMADELKDREIGLRVLKQDIDTTTPTGRLVFHILAAIDEFSRELIVEGTIEGLAAAKADGRTGGRQCKLTPDQARTLTGMYAAQAPDGHWMFTVGQIMSGLGIRSKDTLYAYLTRAGITERRGLSPAQQEAIASHHAEEASA